jgi:hypothetical protein
MKLKPLVSKLKLGYVNSAITDEHFPYQKFPKGKFKVFQFNEVLSTEEVLEKIKAENYRPATIHELLKWADKNWSDSNWLTGLGSVWRGRNGNRYVPYLYWGGDERSLYLDWLGVGWDGYYHFLAVSENLGTQTVNPCKNCKILEVKLAKIKEINV